MPSSILATLLWKEVLRIRYNWGLLVMVAAVLALAILLSVSARLGQLPGQQGRKLRGCKILHQDFPVATAWARHLRENPPSLNLPAFLQPSGNIETQVMSQESDSGRPLVQLLPDELGIELIPIQRSTGKVDHFFRYWIPIDAEEESLPYRIWFLTESQRLLSSQPLTEVYSQTTPSAFRRVSDEDRVPIFVTGLVIFSFYLLSFNLYLTSTGEERDKKALLALMLTPARPVDIIGAKVIFYSTAALLVAMTIAAIYQPRLLLEPRLWLTILVGSTCYIAIATVVLCLVRRQTTLNTVSMMYLIFTALVMFLAAFLLPFELLKLFLIENYVFRQLVAAVSEQPSHRWPLDFCLMIGITATWVMAAVSIFRSMGMKLAHAHR